MSLNLTELKDESLGKQPIQAFPTLYCQAPPATEQSVVAADEGRCITFDVDGLSDEALDSWHAHPAAYVCVVFETPSCRPCGHTANTNERNQIDLSG